ncbi:MAG: ATP synthase F1 subunit gamma [Deltaproteobacteria bacterium]|jgi:F-type H+-transporting ATPase subunit gamma|nr:ATP synthase F1 subunit gamma [Deltaproteobacteria bacterium]
MSVLKEIRRRITSVGSTKQITKAMKLVSAAKLKKAQDLMHNGQNFAFKLGEIIINSIEDVKRQGAIFAHPLLEHRKKINKVRIIVIGADRGLCGGYNVNLFKALEEEVASFGAEVEFVLFGRQAVNIARRLNYQVVREYIDLPEQIQLWPIEELTYEVIGDFISGKCDKLYICYTKFNSTVSQKVVIEKILPFSVVDLALNKESLGQVKGTGVSTRGVKYSSSPQDILAKVMPIMMTVIIKQAIFIAKTSEHAARMTAMDSATHNADELIANLKLFYNRARQSSITTELLDVLGGANAVK